jgi:hypothetical protein
MNTHSAPLTLAVTTLLALASTGCAVDRSQPPPRSSPALVSLPVSSGSSIGVGVRDLLQRELVWYDVDSDRVVALRGGERVELQDRSVRASITDPVALRAFDDGSFALMNNSTVALFPVGRATVTLPLVTFTEPALDGNSIDGDVVIDSVLGYGACHIDHGVLEPCVEVPNVGAVTLQMALGTDGMPLMSDRENRLYRIADGRAELLHDFGDTIMGMRRAGGELFVSTYASGIYAIDGRNVRRIRDGYTLDTFGTAADFHYATFDAESEQVDPACQSGWFNSCEQRRVWSQLVIFESANGRTVEVGHVNCFGTEDNACSFEGFGLDGDTLVLFGNPMRRLGTSNP